MGEVIQSQISEDSLNAIVASFVTVFGPEQIAETKQDATATVREDRATGNFVDSKNLLKGRIVREIKFGRKFDQISFDAEHQIFFEKSRKVGVCGEREEGQEGKRD